MRFIAFLAIAFLVSLSICQAEVPLESIPDSSYSGRIPGSGWSEVAGHNARWAIFYYYRLHERWPLRWSDVVDEGLYQAPLLGFKGQVINPDDGRLDFISDFTYVSPVNGFKPATVQSLYIAGPTTQRRLLSGGRTYVKLFTMADTNEGGTRYSALLSDPESMRLYAILGISEKCIYHYKGMFGDYPKSWQEFVASGLGPVDANSINPVTRKPLRGDGSAGDFLYEYFPVGTHGMDKSSFRLRHMLRDGSKPTFGFSY